MKRRSFLGLIVGVVVPKAADAAPVRSCLPADKFMEATTSGFEMWRTSAAEMLAMNSRAPFAGDSRTFNVVASTNG